MKEKTGTQKTGGTVDDAEIARFSRIAAEWWDENGKFRPLHRINPLRIQWILDQLGADNAHKPFPLTGLTLLDIGCGGGLIAEPMARLGAQVTAIDAGEKNINVAKLHAEQSGLAIDYRCTTAEALVRDWGLGVGDWQEQSSPNPHSPPPNPPLFDVVLALEVIEHVADVAAFVAAAVALLKPGGTLIVTTLNRTAKSYALAIVGAEYVLRWLPRGTHDWKKFLRPSELCAQLRQRGIKVSELAGMVFHPLSGQWRLDKQDLSVNYLLAGKKPESANQI